VRKYAGPSATLDHDYQGYASLASWYHESLSVLKRLSSAVEVRWAIWNAPASILTTLATELGSLQQFRERCALIQGALTRLEDSDLTDSTRQSFDGLDATFLRLDSALAGFNSAAMDGQLGGVPTVGECRETFEKW